MVSTLQVSLKQIYSRNTLYRSFFKTVTLAMEEMLVLPRDVKQNKNMSKTRKYSCVNARGIPPAVRQVHAMLFQLGVPPPPPPSRSQVRMGGRYTPSQVQTEGVPPPGPGKGYPPCRPGKGVCPPPPMSWMGYPPPPRKSVSVNRLTFPSINITFPRTSYASGNWLLDHSKSGCWRKV